MSSHAKKCDSSAEQFDLPLISSNEIHCRIIQYDASHYVEHEFDQLSDFDNYLDRSCCFSGQYCTWIHVVDLSQLNLIDSICQRFHLHQLIQDDISTINERMKVQVFDHGSSIYLLMKMISLQPDQKKIRHEQISFFLKEKNFLLTFREKEDSDDLFQLMRSRLKNNRGRIRFLKIDYLFYSLLDMLVENYMSVLNYIGTRIDPIEKLLIKKFHPNAQPLPKDSHFELNLHSLRLIFQIKHEMLLFRILCQPLKEIVLKLQKTQDRISMISPAKATQRRQYRRKKRVRRINLSGHYFFNPNLDSADDKSHKDEDGSLFNEYIFIYFKDLHDQIIQLNDRIDYYSDTLSGLILFYMVLIDAERNELMTCLSLVSIIFIPLSFLVSLFSMNFGNTPPLNWHAGYFLIVAIAVTAALLMFSFFKWKKWL